MPPVHRHWLLLVGLALCFAANSVAGQQQYMGILPGLPSNGTVYDCSTMSNVTDRLFVIHLNSTHNEVYLGNVTIRNCPFGALRLTAAAPNATFSCAGCTFQRNTLPANQTRTPGLSDDGVGGAVLLADSNARASPLTLTLTGCLFEGNGHDMPLRSAYGTTVQLVDAQAVKLTIEDTTFRSNWGEGPTLTVLRAKAQVMLRSSVFEDNSGGALSVRMARDGSQVEGVNTRFARNGPRYGALYFSFSSFSANFIGLDYYGCTFVNNTGYSGGAIYVETSSTSLHLHDCLLDGNVANGVQPNSITGQGQGGAIYASNARVMLSNTTLRINRAREGGALWVDGEYESLMQANTTFEGNVASESGGGIFLGDKGRAIFTTGVHFVANSAALGGAIACKQCNGVRTTANDGDAGRPGTFLHNHAQSAGAVALICPLQVSSFEDNTLFYNNSAVVYSSASAQDCVLGSSGLGGAVCLSILRPDAGLLVEDDVSFEANRATSGGVAFVSAPCFGFSSGRGAVQVDQNVTLRSNAALGGAGGAVFATDLAWISAACRDADTGALCDKWANNTATGYGDHIATAAAGIAPVWPQLAGHESGAVLARVGVQLVDGLGQNVTAGTYDAESQVVTVSLEAVNTSASGFGGGGGLRAAGALSGATLNVSRAGRVSLTQLVLRGYPGEHALRFECLTPIVRESAGVGLVSSNTSMVVSVRGGCVVGSIYDPSTFKCAPCGDSPPTYSFNPLNATCDACPRGAACSVPEAPAAQVVPLDGFWHSSPLSPQVHRCPWREACSYARRMQALGQFQGSMTGNGTVAWSLPQAQASAVTANASAGNNSTASGEQQQLQQQRRQVLQAQPADGNAATNGSGNSSSLVIEFAAYWALQCAPGYGGVMCSQCAPGYGANTNGCARCPASGLNTLYYVLSYSITVLLLVITIRAQVAEAKDEPGAAYGDGHLQQQGPDGAVSGAAGGSSETSWEGEGQGAAKAAGRGGARQQQPGPGAVGALDKGSGGGGGRAADDGANGAASGEVAVSAHGAGAGSAADADAPLRDISVMKVIIKIFVNYLQVSSVLRQVDLVYPAAVIKLFDIGSQISSAVGRLVSLDCSLSDGMSKAAQRTIINILLPGACVAAALPLWLLVYAVKRLLAGGRRAHEAAEAEADHQPNAQGEGVAEPQLAPLGAYLPRRMVISTITIIFFFYPSVTNELLSLLSCSRLDEQGGAYGEYAAAVGLFWDSDYGVRCFSGMHAGLVWGLAVPGLLLFSVGVPLASALWLWRAARRRLLGAPSFASRYAFLYSDYARETWYWWESAIMLRKLAVVAVAVGTVSRPLIVQIHCLLAVVLLAGLAHLLARPYACALFNRLEAISLGATVFSLWLCYFFMLQESEISYGARVALSVCLFATNIGMLLYFLHCLLLEVWRYAVWALDKDGDGQVRSEEVRAYLKDKLGGALAALAAALAPSSTEQQHLPATTTPLAHATQPPAPVVVARGNSQPRQRRPVVEGSDGGIDVQPSPPSAAWAGEEQRSGGRAGRVTKMPPSLDSGTGAGGPSAEDAASNSLPPSHVPRLPLLRVKAGGSPAHSRPASARQALRASGLGGSAGSRASPEPDSA